MIFGGSTNTVETDRSGAFAVWITGLPASGKSTLTTALKSILAERGAAAAVLESDAVRRGLGEESGYSNEDRDRFYSQLLFIGNLLLQHGVPVIFDATASRRTYRDQARASIPRFLEVYVRCPLETCMKRDPKGIYRSGRSGKSTFVPGLQAEYEAPLAADITVDGDGDAPAEAARRVVQALEARGFLGPPLGGLTAPVHHQR